MTGARPRAPGPFAKRRTCEGLRQGGDGNEGLGAGRMHGKRPSLRVSAGLDGTTVRCAAASVLCLPCLPPPPPTREQSNASILAASTRAAARRRARHGGAGRRPAADHRRRRLGQDQLRWPHAWPTWYSAVPIRSASCCSRSRAARPRRWSGGSARALHEALGRRRARRRRGWPGAAPFTASARACCAMHAPSIGLDPSFTVLDRGDSEDLLHVAASAPRAGRDEAPVPAARRPASPSIRASSTRSGASADVLAAYYPWCAPGTTI